MKHGIVLLSFLVILHSGAVAQDLGRAGPSYVGAGSWPSGDKPQSKLWFHDGVWWGSLFSAGARAFDIHRLDPATQTWVDTGTTIDGRNTSHADCLSDGNALYVGSHHYQGTGYDGFPMLVLRFTYGNGAYTLDPGFPVQVSNSSSEAMTIARDSTGTVWAAWTSGQRVWIAHTLGDDLAWAAPFVLPANTTDIGTGDICSIVRFQDRVGILWSDHASDFFYFTHHQDGAPAAAWSVPEPVLDQADDHVHLKATSDGRVLALLKDDNDVSWLAVRAAGGGWSRQVVSSAADGWTRSILAVDEESRRLLAFGTEPLLGGTIYAKMTSLDAPAFAPGRGSAFMRVDGDPQLNDATSTKQALSSATGLVLLASHQPSRQYWFRGVPLRPSSVRPSASFAGAPRSGSVPLEVSFTDTSSGEPSAWFWTFGDGATSTERDPVHVYRAVGEYTVTLEVTNAAGSDVHVEPAFVRVTGPRVRPVDDAFVRPGPGRQEWGSHPHLRVGGPAAPQQCESYLRFDLSGIDPAAIGSTFLRLHADSTDGDGFEVYLVGDGWHEDDLTWDARPARLGPVPAHPRLAHDGWIELDFGPLLGRGVVDLALVGTGASRAQISSREGPNPPELVTMPPPR